MRSAEEFINGLLHAEYDPEARRRYYLRNRKLKGRQPGSDVSTEVDRPSAAVRPGIGRPDRATLPVRAKPTTSKTDEIEAKVADLKAKFEKLREVLRELVKQAQARSGQEPADRKPPTTKPKTPDKLTPQQQAEKAKSDADYYEQNKSQILPEQVKELEGKVRAIQEKINAMRDKLAKPEVTTQPARKIGSVGARSKHK